MKFLWYSDKIVQSYLGQKQQKIVTEHEFGSTSYNNLYKINKLFSAKPWGMVHDISNHAPHPFDIVTDINYQFDSCDRSFGEICLQTAQTIVLGTDKPIAVCWSGGIDSTVALTALLQVAPPDRIFVVLNEDSINEYPNFYQDIIKDRIATLTHCEWLEQFNNFYTVSGDTGDVVWGVIDKAFWKQHEHFNTPWRDWINTDIAPSTEFIEEFCSWSGTKIHTVLELRIWFYLCCKWQDKAMMFFARTPGMTPLLGNGFFNYKNFQNWTMNNMDQIIGNAWHNYKIPAKQFINNFHNDADWFATKTKFNSGTIDMYTTINMILNDHSTFAISDAYHSCSVKSWPFVDPIYIEDWNDQYNLWPTQLFDK
jgi:hypothetical protein